MSWRELFEKVNISVLDKNGWNEFKPPLRPLWLSLTEKVMVVTCHVHRKPYGSASAFELIYCVLIT